MKQTYFLIQLLVGCLSAGFIDRIGCQANIASCHFTLFVLY